MKIFKFTLSIILLILLVYGFFWFFIKSTESGKISKNLFNKIRIDCLIKKQCNKIYSWAEISDNLSRAYIFSDRLGYGDAGIFLFNSLNINHFDGFSNGIDAIFLMKFNKIDYNIVRPGESSNIDRGDDLLDHQLIFTGKEKFYVCNEQSQFKVESFDFFQQVAVISPLKCKSFEYLSSGEFYEMMRHDFSAQQIKNMSSIMQLK